MTTAPAPASAIPVLSGIREIAERYDGFVLDLWGVIHDGIRPYPGAAETLLRLREAGRRTVLLSNAPRRAGAVIRGMERMGIPRESYGEVLSSGEAAWQALRDRAPPCDRLGPRCFHLGPERDRNMLEGLEVEEVTRPSEADFILNTGVDRDDETVADYDPVLTEGAAAGATMVCANPDLVVMRGGAMVVCAGLLARRYEELGGEVIYFGKPHAPIYRTCLALMGIGDPARLVAVGDSLRTDVAGATAAGIDAVLVTGGIHAEELGIAHGTAPDPARLAAVCAAAGQRPMAGIAAFTW